MERVFAKYEKFKEVLESYLEDADGRIRKLFTEGALHIFDAENPQDEDASPGHRLNIGVYENPDLVMTNDSLNTVFFDNRLPFNILNQQFKFFTSSSGVILDVAFSLNKSKYDELKSNLKELKGIEHVLSKVHQDHVPLRKHQFNNVKFFSKYLVGESVGGDYFDIEEVNKKVYFFLASFNSYVTSVNFIKNITILKNSGGDIFKAVNKYIHDVKSEIKGIIFLEVDSRSLNVKYLSHGDFLLYSSNNNLNQQTGEFLFKPGDSVLVGSEGFKKLISGHSKGFDFSSVSEQEVNDIYNDCFSYLSNEKKGRFLSFDATLISIVVNNNIIKEVGQ